MTFECPYGRSGDTCVPVMHDYPCICRLEARVGELEASVVSREARRLEITEWLEDQIGTAYGCDCGYHTYHSTGKECADCGADFPLVNLLAFKLHASGTENEEYLDRSRQALASEGTAVRELEDLDCPRCGGSGHKDDITVLGEAERAVVETSMKERKAHRAMIFCEVTVNKYSARKGDHHRAEKAWRQACDALAKLRETGGE